MAKRVQLMTNTKEWQTVNGVEVLVDIPQEDLDPITDSSCVEIEGHRTLEETINQENMFTPKIVETKVHSKVGGVYHDNVVDGAYEEAILYGNTQVNLVESITNDTKYIPHSFTSFQGNESKIGIYHSGRTNQVAPLVKGVTMVNLCQETSVTIVEGGNGGAIENVKPNTEYTLVLDFTVQNTQKGFSIHSFKDNTYLETTMIIIGMGEKVKLTFTTHEEANKIYIVNNTGYGGEIQLDNIMVIEGDVTDLDLPFFKGMRSVELSRPLTNLFTDNTVMTSSSCTVTNTNGNITVTSDSIGSWKSANFCLQESLKPNTKYLVMWDSLVATQTSIGATIINTYDLINNTSLKTSDSDIIRPTFRSYVFDTGNVDVNDIAIRIHATTSNSETGTTTVKGLRVFEWDDSLRTLDLQTIGYFSGTKYVSVRALETEGKNLYPYGDVNFTPTLENAWYDAKGNAYMTGDIAKKSKSRFLLKKGTYTFTVGNTSNCYYQLIDDKEQLIASVSTFNLTQDTYCTIRIKAVEANVATTATNIQIERGETATTYEAYQGRYYKPRETEEIILRSLPNGVCDTFNLQTGEYIQRVGEIVLDNTETWGMDTTENAKQPNTNIFYTAVHSDFKPLGTVDRVGSLVCDKVNVVPNLYFVDKVGIMSNTDPRVYVRVLKTDAPNVATFTTYIQNNPLTLQYELKEPIITKLQTYNRTYSGQTNALVDMGNNLSALTYYSSNYYLKVSNLSPVPAILEPITSIPYDVRLKPSTLYTVKYNRGGYSNSMSFDLGGSVVEKINATDLGIVPEEFTVKTPTILSHEQIRLSGTGYTHNFIIVEGDITGTELPYFEGMKDVKMPIVKNTNSDGTRVNSVYAVQGEIPITSEMIEQGGFTTGNPNSDGSYETTKYGEENGNYLKRLRSKNLIPVKPNTTYAFAHPFSRFAYNVYQWNGNKEFIDGVSQYFASGQIETITTTADTQYIHFLMSKHNANETITVAEYDWSQFHMYELDSTINLRSLPNGVKDELNLLTGEYIQRVGEIVLDGSEPYWSNNLVEVTPDSVRTWQIIGSTDNSFESVFPNMKYTVATTVTNFHNNRLLNLPYDSFFNGSTSTFTLKNQLLTQNEFQIRLPKNVLSSHDVDGIKQWLNSNPLTIQYELAQPIISHVCLVSNNQEREVGVKLPNGVCNTYNPSTGITTVRVGKVVLDGSENWKEDTAATKPTDLIRFAVKISDMRKGKPYNTGDFVYESNISYNIVNNDIISPRKLPNIWNYYENNIYMDFSPTAIGMTTSDTTETKLSKFKTYLASNPITVWYELNYPQIQPNIVLPNGVHDEYNPKTGVYTKRVGFIELDGSEHWVALSAAGYFYTEAHDVLRSSDYTKIMICDGLPIAQTYGSVVSSATLTAYPNNDLYPNENWIYMIGSSYTTKNELISSLSQNPIKVWYELATPITYQLTPYFGLPQPYAYEDGYLIHESAYPETTLPPEFKYKLVANRTGQIVQNGRKLQEHTTRLSNLEALIIEATIESLFNRELQLFELELMDIQLVDLGE